MAATCAINFLTSVSYSTSIVLWGLLPVLRRERWQTTVQWRFFASLVTRVTKVLKLSV